MSDKGPSERLHSLKSRTSNELGEAPDILQQTVKEKKKADTNLDHSRDAEDASNKRSPDILQQTVKEKKKASRDKTDIYLKKALKKLNKEAARDKENVNNKKEVKTTEEISGDIHAQAKGLRQEKREGYVQEIEIADSGDKIQIHYPLPESPELFRDFSVASIYDFDRRAQGLQTHIHRADTQGVYVSLYQLQQEKGAVDALNSAFEHVSGRNIDQALSTRWSGPALEYARQLIGTSEKTSEYAIGHVPSHPEEFSRIAERTHQILSDTKGFVPEKLFATLTPLRRNAYLIQKVAHSYQDKFGGNLATEIRTRLGTGKAADFGRFLLGEQKLEQKAVSMKEAERLSAAFSHQTFEAERVIPMARADINDEEWPSGTVFSSGSHTSETIARWRSHVPYGYSVDGCYARTSIMSLSLKEMGYGSEKVAMIGTRSDGKAALEIQSDYAPDGDVDKRPLPTNFHYHMAPMIQIETDAGNRGYILDPTPEPNKAKLWSVESWQTHLYKGSVESKSFSEFTEMIEAAERGHPDGSRNRYALPPGRVFFFSFDRDYDEPPRRSRHIIREVPSIPDLNATKTHYDYSKRALASFINDSINNSIAAAIRRERAAREFNPERFSREMSRFPEKARAAFPQAFPRLFGTFSRTLNTDQERQFQEHFVGAVQNNGSDRYPDMQNIYELE